MHTLRDRHHTLNRSRQLRKDEKYNFDNRDYDSFRL
jgi:hypothetical protein